MPLCSVLMMHLVSHTHAGCDASVVLAPCSVEVLIKLLGSQRSKKILLDERSLSLTLCLFEEDDDSPWQSSVFVVWDTER